MVKISIQIARANQIPDFSFPCNVSVEFFDFDIGPIDKRTGERAYKRFVGIVVDTATPFPVLYANLRAHFANRRIAAFLECEGHRYALNTFTNELGERNKLVIASCRVLRTLVVPVNPAPSASKVSLEQTVPYWALHDELVALRKLYPNMEIKVIDPVRRTITFRLNTALVNGQKSQVAARLATAS